MSSGLARAAEFEGLYNFRDLGGLKTEDGAEIKKGRVFRSDAFATLTDADARVLLTDINVERLIDLRAVREVEAETATLLEVGGVEVRRRPIDNGPGTAIESAPAGERLAFRYLEYLEYASSSITGAIRDLAEPDQKVTIIHCRAGKDRTGVVVATVLSLVGATPDEIARDYALTSIGMPKIMARLLESDVYRANVSSLPEEMYSAEEVTMRQFLTIVADRHGSLTEWSLENGVSVDELAALRENLVGQSS